MLIEAEIRTIFRIFFSNRHALSTVHSSFVSQYVHAAHSFICFLCFPKNTCILLWRNEWSLKMAARYGGILWKKRNFVLTQIDGCRQKQHQQQQQIYIWYGVYLEKFSGLMHSRIIDFFMLLYMLLVHVSDVCTWKTHRIILIYMQPPGAAGGENDF